MSPVTVCGGKTEQRGNSVEQIRECRLADGFSFREKSYTQLSFFTFTITGTVGIVLADWLWALPYLVVFGYGVPGVVMRHLTCPRCSHLYRFNDCLQFPVKWTRWLVKNQKTRPFSTGERGMFWFIFSFLTLYPVYWLLAQPALLAVFGYAAVLWYLGQWMYFCKRCRVRMCPFNRAQEPVVGE